MVTRCNTEALSFINHSSYDKPCIIYYRKCEEEQEDM